MLSVVPALPMYAVTNLHRINQYRVKLLCGKILWSLALYTTNIAFACLNIHISTIYEISVYNHMVLLKENLTEYAQMKEAL